VRLHAITLWQPWATLIAQGHKRIETRSWSSRWLNWPPLLAIHAASMPMRGSVLKLRSEEPFAGCLASPAYAEAPAYTPTVPLPAGAVVAVCRFVEALRTEFIADILTTLLQHGKAGPHEMEFGDYSEGRWGWMLEDICPLSEPIRTKGAQGVWGWDAPADLADRLRGPNADALRRALSEEGSDVPLR
jgi:hypothetical protein